jgi:hypothetical protein
MRGLTSAHLRALADLVGLLADGGVITGVCHVDDAGWLSFPEVDVAVIRSMGTFWFAEITYADDGTTLLALTDDGWREVT